MIDSGLGGSVAAGMGLLCGSGASGSEAEVSVAAAGAPGGEIVLCVRQNRLVASRSNAVR